MTRLIKRSPDKACDNLLPLAVLLTLASMVRHPRWYWTWIRYGKDCD